MKRQSTPGTAAIFSTFSTPALLSICTMTISELSASAAYSGSVLKPKLEGANMGPKPRVPRGGYLEYWTIRAASYYTRQPARASRTPEDSQQCCTWVS